MSIEALLAHYGLAAVFLGAGIEGETVVVAGGLMAHRGLVPLAGAMAAASAGSFVADQLFFLAGRRFRDHPRVRRIAERPGFARALAMLEAYPVGFIFAFRFLYGLRTISPIAIGTTRISARTFVLVNLASAIIWGIAFSTIGYLFGTAFERFLGRLVPGKHALLIGVAIVVAVALLVQGIFRWRRRAA